MPLSIAVLNPVRVMGEFQDAVSAWRDKALKEARTIMREAIEMMVDDMVVTVFQGGRMRFKDGFLRSSLLAQLEVPIVQVITKPEEGRSYTLNMGDVKLVINRMQLGQTIHIGFTANYARPREFGANGQPPDAFVRTYTADWSGYVQRATALVRARR